MLRQQRRVDVNPRAPRARESPAARFAGKMAMQIRSHSGVSSIVSDASRATTNPSPNKRTWSIDYATWPAARVWHFLNGIVVAAPRSPRCSLRRRRVHAARDATRPGAGTIVARAGKIAIYCNDGIVEGKQLPWRARLGRWLRRTSSRR